MGLTLKEFSGDFESYEPGTYQAKCYIMADIGTQVYEGKGNKKVVISWELEEKMADGRPFVISKTYGAFLSQNSILRKDLESWRGKVFSKEELEGFDMCKILGKNCLLGIIKNEKNKMVIKSVSALPKNTILMEGHNAPVALDLDHEAFNRDDFEMLPEWIRRYAEDSPEYAALQNPLYAAPASEVALDSEEEIAF